MSKFGYDVEQLNWSKGPTALEIMTCSLYNYTRGTWKKFISELSDDEQKHISMFILHVKDNKITGNRDKANKIVWKCNCEDNLCQSIISRLLEKHQNPGSRKLIWKIDDSTEQYESPEDYYWELAKMFMLHGTEKTKEICTMPEDTDLTLILKMMKNCKLFHLSDNVLYEEVLGVRNSLMHSSHYKISFDTLKEYFDVITSFLDAINDKDDVDQIYKWEIENALEELNSLLCEKIRIELTIDELEIIIKALECQENTIQRELQFRSVTTSRDPEELNERLQNSKKQIKQYTIIINVYRPALSIRDETERKQAIAAIEKRLNDEEEEEKRKIEEERRRREEEERMRREEAERRRREEEERRRREEEERMQREKEERRRREEEERRRREEEEKKRKKVIGVGGVTAGVYNPAGAVAGGTGGGVSRLTMLCASKNKDSYIDSDSDSD